jgi:hypothetical protein
MSAPRRITPVAISAAYFSPFGELLDNGRGSAAELRGDGEQ